MNLGSEKLSPNDMVAMLKEMNPPTRSIQTTPQPVPFLEEWLEMLDHLYTLNQNMEVQTSYLKKLNELLAQLPTQKQMDEMLKRTVHLEQMVEQAGKKKERRFSISKISLPDFSDISWSPLMILIPLLLVTLFMGWYSLDKLLNAFSQIIP